MEAKRKVAGLKRRHRRVRKKIVGSAERPRLAVYRSNRHMYAQLIDDLTGHTLAFASTVQDGPKGDPKERAKEVGRAIAKKGKDAGVTGVVFDRGGFRYHGRVAAVAEGAREGGLEF